MFDGLERRVVLRLFPSNPRHEGEVVDVPVKYALSVPIIAKNTKRRGDIQLTPRGDIHFKHNIAKVRPAPFDAARFEFVDSDGDEGEEGKPNRDRHFRVESGGAAGVWPKEKIDRFYHQGRRFSRAEVISKLAR